MILTGDNPRAAAAIAIELALDYRAGLLPEDKVMVVAELSRQRPTVMIGDGINDAPAMNAASIGIAMGSSSYVALETAYTALTPQPVAGRGGDDPHCSRHPRQYPAEHHHYVWAERGIPDHQSARVDRLMASSAGGFRCHRAGDIERTTLAEKASLTLGGAMIFAPTMQNMPVICPCAVGNGKAPYRFPALLACDP